MDVVLDTLSYMEKLDRINHLIFQKIKLYLCKNILEAGCGNGNLTSYFLEYANDGLVIAIDNDDAMLAKCNERFSAHPNLKIRKCDLADLKVREIKWGGIDTIVCSNMLEHVKDDEMVLSNFKTILKSGNLIIVVPALKFLYNSLDKAAGHYRRYGIKELSGKLRKCGFMVDKSMYVNFFGIFGWFLNGTVLKREKLSRYLLSLFNFMVPVFEFLEKLIGPPVGLSIVMVCKKKT